LGKKKIKTWLSCIPYCHIKHVNHLENNKAALLQYDYILYETVEVYGLSKSL